MNTKEKYHVYVADTGSTSNVKKRSKALLATLFEDDYTFIEYDYYNFAKINNDVAKNHLHDDVDVLVFCNNDIEIITDGLIDRMSLAISNNPDLVGTCGCRLLYPNGAIQHDGQFVILPKFEGDRLQMGHRNLNCNPKYLQRKRPISVSGNTFALCATSRKLFEKIGMLSEEYIECFEDVEYNLECKLLGLKNVILESDYWASHHESLSRGKTEEAMRKLQEDYKISMKFIAKNYSRLI